MCHIHRRFVDLIKDLHFEKDEDSSSGVEINNTNLLNMQFDKTRESMANRVWVYGDRQLTGVKETLVSGTAPSTTGSDYTLTYGPHNVQIETTDAAGVILKGGVLNMITSPTSGIDYLVNFEDREIVFVSGTDIGYDTIPTGTITINYDRDVPIIKFGENRNSIKAFGPKELIISDKSIKDPITAKDILFKALEDSDPFNRFDCKIRGWETFKPGQTVVIDLDDFNIDQKTTRILEIEYLFTKRTIESNNIITVRLDRKTLDITDEIKRIRLNVESLQTEQQNPSDVLTRFESTAGSIVPVGSLWYIQQRTELGSSFILGKGSREVTGPTFGGILGSIIVSGINFLGDSRDDLVITTSGGFDYSTL